MTSPTPSTGNSAGAQARNDANIVLPSGTSGKSAFGLGNLSGLPVQVGGLLPVMGKDGKAITPGEDGTYTAEQVMQAFANASPGTIAQIQHQLILGGFYSSATYQPNYGVLNPEDLDAFTKATQTAAQTGGNLAEYLTRQAKFGEYQGVAAAMNANGKPRKIQKADPLALSSMIEKEFQSLTGRKPTDAERAGFIAAYNAAFTEAQNNEYDNAENAGANLTASQRSKATTLAANLDAAGYSSAPPQYQAPDTRYFSDHQNDIGIDAHGINQQLAAQDTANLLAEPTAPATPGSYTAQDFDPQAFAEDYVRRHATGEMDAHDVSTQFGTFMQLIGGIKG